MNVRILLVFIVGLFSISVHAESRYYSRPVFSGSVQQYYFNQELKQYDERAAEISASKTVSSMSLRQKLCQLIIAGLDGKEAEKKSSVKKEQPDPGGYLLFSYNIADSAEAVSAFIAQKKTQYNTIPPLIAVDHEGGIVNRLKNILSPLPSARQISSALTPQQAFAFYYLTAVQLKRLGIDVNFAPVAETLTEENKSFLDSRSFGSQEQTIAYSKASVRAHVKAGVIPVVKHFPGNTNVDPHIGLPIITDTEQYFFERRLVPFKEVLRIPGSAVMMSHAVVPALGKKPACFSSYFVYDVLKDRLKFSGLIFSDDILMKALSSYAGAQNNPFSAALNAGLDFIMICSSSWLAEVDKVLPYVQNDAELCKKIEKNTEKIIAYKLLHRIYFTNSDIFISGNDALQAFIYQRGASQESVHGTLSFADAYEQGLLMYRQFFGGKHDN